GQPLFAHIQIVVVTEAGEPLCIQPRLSRVDLPGVEVEDERFSLAVNGAKPHPTKPVWEQPEVTTTCNRQGIPGKLQCTQWKFGQFIAFIGDQALRPPWRAWHAVPIMVPRKDRGVPGVALICQYIQRPASPICDGSAGGLVYGT